MVLQGSSWVVIRRGQGRILSCDSAHGVGGAGWAYLWCSSITMTHWFMFGGKRSYVEGMARGQASVYVPMYVYMYICKRNYPPRVNSSGELADPERKIQIFLDHRNVAIATPEMLAWMLCTLP